VHKKEKIKKISLKKKITHKSKESSNFTELDFCLCGMKTYPLAYEGLRTSN
jgi:hypothetical protein